VDRPEKERAKWWIRMVVSVQCHSQLPN
jgi:hypothetical protein